MPCVVCLPAVPPRNLPSDASLLRRFISAGVVVLLCSSSAELRAQYSVSAPPRPTSIILPEANRVPDANDRMVMREAHQLVRDFDAVNASRQKQIDDDTTKLLILANDLKRQMDRLGGKPPSDRLVREAEVIELLAHDVQTKMTLMVGGG